VQQQQRQRRWQVKLRLLQRAQQQQQHLPLEVPLCHQQWQCNQPLLTKSSTLLCRPDCPPPYLRRYVMSHALICFVICVPVRFALQAYFRSELQHDNLSDSILKSLICSFFVDIISHIFTFFSLLPLVNYSWAIRGIATLSSGLRDGKQTTARWELCFVQGN